MKKSSAIYIGLLIFLFGQTIHAEDVHATGWRLTPYAWLPATIDVDSTVAGTTVPIDMDLSDVDEHFDVFAFSMRGEYWWGQWGVVVDGMWTDLEGKGVDLPIPFIDSGKVEIDEGILDVLAAYRFQIFDEGKTGRSQPLLHSHYTQTEKEYNSTFWRKPAVRMFHE